MVQLIYKVAKWLNEHHATKNVLSITLDTGLQFVDVTFEFSFEASDVFKSLADHEAQFCKRVMSIPFNEVNEL